MPKVIPLYGSEYELAQAVQRGDAKAQNELYNKYAGKFMTICLRYINDKMTAEDVMIQGIMRIFDKINQFNFAGSFEGWMKRIIVNEALMKIRTSKNFDVDIETIPDTGNEVDFSADLHAEDLLNLVSDLPVGYRTVFNLYAIEGYSHAEIASQLQISEGTSKSQLSRARAILQSKLQSLDSNFKKSIQ